MNLGDVANGIAGQFANLSATVEGKSETVTGTAELPNALSKGPALLVLPPAGVLGRDLGHQRDDQLDFTVRFLRDPVSLPARSRALYAWYDVLRDRVERNYDLGLSYVQWAMAVAVRMDMDGETYAQPGGRVGTYDVIDLTIRVLLREPVATDAI